MILYVLAYPVGLGLNIGPSLIFIHIMCIPAAKVLTSLRIFAGSHEHSLLDNAIGTKSSSIIFAVVLTGKCVERP